MAPALPQTLGEVDGRCWTCLPQAGGGLTVSSHGACAFPSLTWFHVSYYTPDVRSVDGQSGPKAVLSLQHD